VIALIFLTGLTWWFFEKNRILVLHGGMPYFTPFILGMLMVHVQPWLKPWMGRVLALIGVLGILGFGIDHPLAATYRGAIGFANWEAMWGMGHYVYPACALLVVGVASYKSAFWGNPWLRLVGVVGYGFYLWHPLVIIWFRDHDLPVPLVPSFIISVAIALAGYILIERPGMRLGKYLASKVAANEVVRGIRSVSICLAAVALFVATRYIYALDTDIQVRVEMNAERGVLSQVFATSDKDYTEENSSYVRLEEAGWQTLNFTIADQSLSRLRFDPGDRSGTYEIRSIQINFPFARNWVSLPLDQLIPLSGIRAPVMRDGAMVIETEPGHNDPVLVYEGDLSQPWYRPWLIFWAIFFAGTALLVLLARLLDMVSRRYAPRLDGNALVPS
jgi:hypothetical protein